MGSGEIAEPTNRMSWGSTAILLVGPLSHSGQWRGYLAPDMTRPQVIDGIDRITPPTRWGYQSWRFDRMATACHPRRGS